MLYALGEMTQALRARGDAVTAALWGPKDGAWHRFDLPLEPVSQPTPAGHTAPAGQTAPPPPPGDPAGGDPAEPTRLAERMTDRRHQVLMTALTKAGFYDLSPEDDTTVRAVVERLDEAAVRRVAHWLGTAGGAR
ncbi:hypothetical protein ACIQU3_10060 [Streptomyces sp. NPDC101110]|uniref:hypothetical protein n=1 Tax=Streptomyces sp. NPDC101110 TaxID=3366104 RepID=UPI00382C6FB9